MSNDTTIIFYDIPYAEPNICWSSNTWKTRFCLNYKRLPYKTQWVEYPDIESTCIKIGAAPTDVKEDGITPEYTFPVIYDPTTQRAISESFNIAIYLDTTYPDTPRVFSPTHTQSLHSAFDDLITRRTFPHVGMRIRQLVFERLPHRRSQEYFRRTRESWFGKKIEEFGPRTEEERIRKWSDFEKGLDAMDRHYQIAKNEFGGGEFICGVDPTYGDFILAGFLMWCKTGFGPESGEWKDILKWQDGKWARFLGELEKYMEIH